MIAQIEVRLEGVYLELRRQLALGEITLEEAQRAIRREFREGIVEGKRLLKERIVRGFRHE